jgi:two-component system cell cycle response regulator DivK
MANELILLVEDNDKNRKLARDVLQVKGYRVIEAESAEAGLVLAAEQQPDLVLMDIHLPGMDGLQALTRMREGPATRAIPVIAFTASVMPQERSKIKAAGFDALIAKPIDLKEFVATITTLLKDKA